MNLELTEQQQFFQETTRRFLSTEMPTSRVRELHASGAAFDRAWWSSAAELGWTSLLASEAHGGGSLEGRPVGDAVIVAEEIGRTVAPGPFRPTNLVLAILAQDGSDAQQAPLVPRLVAGELVGAWAVAEPGNRWDPGTLETTAEVRGDQIVLNGTKAYVEAGDEADVFIVTARSAGGLTNVLVASDAAGMTIERCRSIDLVKHFATLHLSDVSLPAQAVVGTLGDASGAVERAFNVALVLQAAEIVGAMDRSFESTLEYMHERYAFGRPIASFQALKHRVADMLLQLETAKATTDAAATALDDGDPDHGRLASVASAYVTDLAPRFLQECVQFLGGIGVTWEHDIHLYLRRAALERALYGTPEFHQDRVAELLAA